MGRLLDKTADQIQALYGPIDFGWLNVGLGAVGAFLPVTLALSAFAGNILSRPHRIPA